MAKVSGSFEGAGRVNRAQDQYPTGVGHASRGARAMAREGAQAEGGGALLAGRRVRRASMPGRISHFKRSDAPDRSRRKDNDGQEICTGCGILAYNADRSQSGSAET